MHVAAVRAPGVDARLPRVPGASWRMKVTRTDPSGAAAGGLLLHRSTRAWAGGRRLDDRPPYEGTDLPVERAPELLRPAIGGALSSHGPGFAWRLGTVRTLSTVAVTDVAHGVFLGRISTNEGAIPLKRLRALGLARLERGAHAVVLTTSSRVELDEAVSPQREVRRRRFDERRAGSTTETRWSFQVTE